MPTNTKKKQTLTGTTSDALLQEEAQILAQNIQEGIVKLNDMLTAAGKNPYMIKRGLEINMKVKTQTRGKKTTVTMSGSLALPKDLLH